MRLGSVHQWILAATGGLLLKAGCWRTALSVLDRAVALDPEHTPSHERRAIVLLKLGRWEEAAAAFRRAGSLDPKSAALEGGLVVALLHLARWNEAITVSKRAIEHHPDHASLHCHLGMALAKMERWEPAASALGRAITLKPEPVDAGPLLAQVLVRLGRWEEAVHAFRWSIARLAPSVRLHLDLADVLARQEQWEAAAGAVQDSLSLDPFQVEGYVRLASLFAQTPASEESVAADRRGVARGLEDDPVSLLRLGIGLMKLGRWEEASAMLDRHGPVAPVDSVLQYLRVDPLVRLGRLDHALTAYRRSAVCASERPPLPSDPAGEHEDPRHGSFWRPDNLPEEVFEVERWLDQLATPGQLPSSRSPSGPRVLVVLDNDYGELTTLMYLVLGQPLLARTTVLVPDRLSEKNAAALPGQTHRYKSVSDVLARIDRDRPDVVLLCSGYLLPIHRLISLAELERMVKHVRQRGCRLVTADPFLGVLSQHDPRELVRIDISPGVDDAGSRQRLVEVAKREEERLWTHFTACEKIFRDTYHLYPAYRDDRPDEATTTDARNISFFNARLIYPKRASRERGAAAAISHHPPHWLFVLSQTDYEAQVLNQEKPFAFVDRVVEKLLETLAAGRHPVLIGPHELIEALGHRMPTRTGVDMLSYCSFNQFMSLLLSAEYAFYWNVLSHSLLIRLFNRLPTIVFDRGHLVRNVPAMYGRVVQWYYQGWEPQLVDQRQPLTLDVVDGWAEAYRRNADRIASGFQRAPSPEEMVDGVLKNDPATPRTTRSDLPR